VEEDMGIPFICECADPACREIIRLNQDEYEAVRAESRHFFNVPGHRWRQGDWLRS